MFFVDKWIHSNSLINVQPEENCRVDELLSCSFWRFLWAKQLKNVQMFGGQKRRTNDERRTTNWLVRIFAIWLVRIPIDWYEFRSIGTNSDRLVRIPNDWSEFRTIGPNSERMTNDEFNVATDVNASNVVKFDKGLNARKKNRRGLV
jgi:hypothetical protein